MTPEYLTNIGLSPNSRRFFEAGVLSCVLLNPEWLNACDIDSSDFAHPEHRRMYESMLELQEDGAPIDAVAVWARSKVSAERISQVVNVAPTSVNLPWYLDRLKRISLEDIRRAEGQKAAESIKEGLHPDEAIGQMNAIIRVAEERLLPRDDQSEFSRVTAEILSRIKSGSLAMETLKTGIPWLDSLCRGLIPGDYVILAARPSCGKTALAVQILAELARSNVPTVFFSREMSQELIAQRLISYFAWSDVTGLMRGEEFDEDVRTSVLSVEPEIRAAAHLIKVIAKGINTIESVERLARIAVTGGARLVVFDYIQLMEISTGRNRNEDVEKFSRRMKAMLVELGVPGIFLSQLSRSCEAENRRPKLSDLRDSGAIEQDADLVWFLHREKINPKDKREDAPEQTVLLQSKGRNVGLGTRRLTFAGKFQRFSPLAGASDGCPDG